MPVSTFSSDTSAARGESGHSAMVARWNSTRDRIIDDERRISEDDMAEMDGTGLYDRPNWPLVDEPIPRAVSPETVISAQSDSPVVEQVSPGAVLRTKEDIAQQPGIHWKEQDVDELPADGSDDEAEMSNDDSRDNPSGWNDRQPRGKIVQSLPGSFERHADVSPVRSERRRSLDVPRRGSQTDVSPVRDGFSSSSSNSEHIPYTNSTEESEREVTPEPGADDDQRDEIDSLYEDEQRDMATPIPFNPRESISDPVPSYPGSPQTIVNGRTTPTANGHIRPSSIAKGTPPQRTISRRSITAQIPFNRERVRYSWQSMQDEEPNRPRIHIIKLVSNTATASAGFPQGEAFGFSISPSGRRIAAYNSARLYILQTAALPVGISQDYALKRRPMAVEIVDDGNVLAILADEHTVNVYDLGHQQLRLIKSIKLDYPTHCICLAPMGGLLAAAYEGGVEIFSLDPSALPTDRRAVRSQRMDRISFSEDGSTLLGTTTRINVSSTVVVSVPVFPSSPSGVPTHEELKEAWCSDLLHPDNIRNSSHAAFMRQNRQTCNDRLFAWNGLADTFGILNISDMQYGNLDFPVVVSPPLSTCGGLGAAIHSCPAIDEHGHTVAMVVNDRTIRLYIVPQNVADGETTVEAHSIDHELDEGYGNPFSEIGWVYSSALLPAPLNEQTPVQGRLVVASPGGVVEANMNEESVDDIEGGRIIMFDFDPQFAGEPGQTFSLTLGRSAPQLLEEPELDVAQEVAIVRRRTVNQNKATTLNQRPAALGRAATSAGARGDRSFRTGSPSLSVNAARRSMISIGTMQLDGTRSLPDLAENTEAVEPEAIDAFEEPYAQNAPRSQASLMRAASNAQRHRFQTLEERTQERVSVESSGNFLPLPEYTEEPNAPLPSRFRAMAGLDVPAAPPASKPAIITNVNGDRASPSPSTPSTAPANIGESFSREQAFASATSAETANRVRTQQEPDRNGLTTPKPATDGAHIQFSPVSRSNTANSMAPVPRSDTFGSPGPMPRSLQRAYGKAAPQPPGLAGDWENVSPVAGPNQPRSYAPAPHASVMQNHLLAPGASTVPEEEPWDAISPISSGNQPAFPFGQAAHASYPHRYSTVPLNSSHPAAYAAGNLSPNRAPSSASSFAPSSSASSTPSSRGRRLPPHMQAFRNAAAANASASLFPPNQYSERLPLRQPSPSPGSVGYSVTAWHPPAPSIASGRSPVGFRGYSRRSSLSNHSAFASTTKARSLGFFRRGTVKQKKKARLFGPEFADAQPGGKKYGNGAQSMMETKSIFTLRTGEGRCAIM